MIFTHLRNITRTCGGTTRGPRWHEFARCRTARICRAIHWSLLAILARPNEAITAVGIGRKTGAPVTFVALGFGGTRSPIGKFDGDGGGARWTGASAVHGHVAVIGAEYAIRTAWLERICGAVFGNTVAAFDDIAGSGTRYNIRAAANDATGEESIGRARRRCSGAGFSRVTRAARWTTNMTRRPSGTVTGGR